ncbi:MAG: TonB-dependent receptor domain-containing protein [Mangrovibacterium sp.]
MLKKTSFIILIVLMIPFMAAAQQQYQLSGTVTDNVTGETVELVAIQILELNKWTASDKTGAFSFKDLPGGEYTLQASCLGYAFYEKRIVIARNITGYKLMLDQLNLSLDEITVVASENTSLSSSSRIESTALEHVQASSLSDVMQLVPGQLTFNPDMSRTNQITIRDINDYERNPNPNNAMGTAIIIDGSPVINDANLQAANTAGGGVGQGYSTAGQGVDLRQIPTENIESVEVIRGIPSAQYGELTTGAVLVKTKAGKSPWNVKLKADPNIRQTALSKGFLLPGKNSGAVNMDMDYTHSYDDPRKPASSYRRVTGQLGYSNTLFRESTPLSINAKVSYYNTFDNQKNDPDMLYEEKIQEKEQSLSFKLYGTWQVNKSWLSNIEYNFSGDFEKQSHNDYRLRSSLSSSIVSTTTEAGESVGIILPSSYYSSLKIDGRPYNYFGTVKASLAKRYGKTVNKLMVGAEWRTSGNNGDGRIYDVTRPPSSAVSTRPRAFKDIPESRQLAFFIEDKVKFPVGKTSVETQAGLRYTNMLPKGIFSTDGFRMLEPRVNFTYHVIERKRKDLVKDLALRFGYGRTSKAPSMIYLYPDKKYNDEISFNYYPDLMVMSTQVIDPSNPDLEPMTNDKFEAGVDLNVGGVKIMLTAFSEHIKNGFGYETYYTPFTYKLWNSLTGTGKEPYYQNGEIYYTENNQTKQLTYSSQTVFGFSECPVNLYETEKKGIEYVIDLGKFEALQSGLNISGAYYHITRLENAVPFYERINVSYLGERFPYVPGYPGNKGSLNQRFNTKFDIITHIPKLRMITSISTQIIWLNKERYYWEDNNGPLAYSLGENNEKLYGQFEGVDKIYVDPVGYYDLEMNYHVWQDNYSFEAPYSFMVRTYDSDYFDNRSNPVVWQVNLKLTKEIGNRATLAFFANNIFNHMPLYKDWTHYYIRLNQKAYFGAELKITL